LTLWKIYADEIHFVFMYFVHRSKPLFIASTNYPDMIFAATTKLLRADYLALIVNQTYFRQQICASRSKFIRQIYSLKKQVLPLYLAIGRK